MVKESLVYLDIFAKTREEFLQKAATLIMETHLIESEDKFYKALLKREEEITTGVGKGVAFPHACGSFVKEPFIAFFRLKNPIDYKSIDDLPVDMFFLIGTPENAEQIHLKILSRLAQNLAEPAFKQALKTCDDANLIIGTFKNIFKPMVILVYNTKEEKEEILKRFSPKINFFLYQNGNSIQPFEVHISDLAISLKKDLENHLFTKTYTLKEAIDKISLLIE